MNVIYFLIPQILNFSKFSCAIAFVAVEEGHSIYVRNLPFSITAAQLEEEFKKFGPIKHGGIQVRNNKVCHWHVTCLECSIFYWMDA